MSLHNTRRHRCRCRARETSMSNLRGYAKRASTPHSADINRCESLRRIFPEVGKARLAAPGWMAADPGPAR